jgi:hypothetical protein
VVLRCVRGRTDEALIEFRLWFDTASGVTNTPYDLHPKFRETAGNVSISAFVTF